MSVIKKNTGTVTRRIFLHASFQSVDINPKKKYDKLTIRNRFVEYSLGMIVKEAICRAPSIDIIMKRDFLLSNNFI